MERRVQAHRSSAALSNKGHGPPCEGQGPSQEASQSEPAVEARNVGGGGHWAMDIKGDAMSTGYYIRLMNH